VRDLVFVADVIDALLAAAALPPVREPRVFNICSGVPVSVRQIGEQVTQQMNVPLSLLRWGELSYRPGEPMRAIGDNRRFFQATGWQPQMGLDEGIARSLTSLRDKSGVRMSGQVMAESAVDSLAPL
jgi:nucleoside-diphosphate-sugar epimerase